MTPQFLDDIQTVMFWLRHKCENIRKIERVIEKIVNGTDLDEERVRAAISHIGNRL